MGVDRPTRRRWLRTVAAAGLTGVAGCSWSSNGDVGTPDAGGTGADVVVGPDGRLRFAPESITVAAGDAVEWYFDSPNHNVSCRPADSSLVRLPPGADPFSSYPAGTSSGSVVSVGDTFEHTFPTRGTYRYVCIPHQRDGMVGRVRVE